MKNLPLVAAICAAASRAPRPARRPIPRAEPRACASWQGSPVLMAAGTTPASMPPRRRVYISHGTQVMVIEADSGKVIQDFAPGDRLHAIVPVPGQGVIVTTNSGDSSARILNGADGQTPGLDPTAKDTDGAVYDPSSGLVLVIDGDSGEVTLVDPKTRASPGSITIGDPLEFGAVDGKGRFFVNLVSKNQVAVVDIASRKVVARYDMPGCERPTASPTSRAIASSSPAAPAPPRSSTPARGRRSPASRSVAFPIRCSTIPCAPWPISLRRCRGPWR